MAGCSFPKETDQAAMDEESGGLCCAVGDGTGQVFTLSRKLGHPDSACAADQRLFNVPNSSTGSSLTCRRRRPRQAQRAHVDIAA
jgi:hypothetical protein